MWFHIYSPVSPASREDEKESSGEGSLWCTSIRKSLNSEGFLKSFWVLFATFYSFTYFFLSAFIFFFTYKFEKNIYGKCKQRYKSYEIQITNTT